MKLQPSLFLFTISSITILSCSPPKKSGYEIDCDYQKRQAQNDFRYENYTWTIFSGLGYDFLGEEEFKKLLTQHKIKNKIIHTTCTPSPLEKYENCGEIEMNKLIQKKFGQHFIDSLRYIAKKEFARNHPDEIFSFEQCDQVSLYPLSDYNTQAEKIQEDYISKYPVSKEYIPKNEESYSYTSAHFIITKNGEIKDLTVQSSFENKKNYIFEKQFNKQLKEFVLQTRWIPAQINGVNVDSYYGVCIHYD